MCFGTLLFGVLVRVAGRVFGAIERLFEGAISGGDQIMAGSWHIEPRVWVILAERPFHHIKGFVDDGVSCLQAGNGAAGAGFEEVGGFVAQQDFAQFGLGVCRGNRKAGAHGVGAAPEAVEDGDHSSIMRSIGGPVCP